MKMAKKKALLSVSWMKLLGGNKWPNLITWLVLAQVSGTKKFVIFRKALRNRKSISSPLNPVERRKSRRNSTGNSPLTITLMPAKHFPQEQSPTPENLLNGKQTLNFIFVSIITRFHFNFNLYGVGSQYQKEVFCRLISLTPKESKIILIWNPFQPQRIYSLNDNACVIKDGQALYVQHKDRST